MRVTISRAAAAPRARKQARDVRRTRAAPAESTRQQHLERPFHRRAGGSIAPCEAGVTSRYVARKRIAAARAWFFGKPSSCRSDSSTDLNHGWSPALRGLRGDAGLQAAEHVHPPCAAVEQPIPPGRGLPLHRRRDPQRRGFADVIRWNLVRNADHGHRLVVDEHLAADDIRCAAEGLGPVSHVMTTTGWASRTRSSDSAMRRPRCGRTPRLEGRARHDFRQHRLMLPSRRQVHRRRMPAQDAVEELRLRLQIAAHRVGHQVATAPAVRERIASPVDQHDAVRIPIGSNRSNT